MVLHNTRMFKNYVFHFHSSHKGGAYHLTDSNGRASPVVAKLVCWFTTLQSHFSLYSEKNENDEFYFSMVIRQIAMEK